MATHHTLALTVVVGAAVTGAAACAPLDEMMPIEAAYAAAGPFDVSTELLVGRDGTPYRMYVPDTDDADLKVVAWGNGTIANPANYVDIHRHLASRGFLVVDSFSETTGTGAEIAASIGAVADENEREGSPLYRRIDIDNVAAVGHSQGATGVINAQTDFPEGAHISTVVSIALPALHWCEEKDKYDTAALSSSLLILGGGNDMIVSPWFSNQNALRQLSPDLRGAMATANEAGHSAIEGDAALLRGYLTAWIEMQVNNDDVAADAFAGPYPEIAENPRWRDVERRRTLY